MTSEQLLILTRFLGYRLIAIPLHHRHVTSATRTDPVDVRDMLAVHDAMLREFRLAPRLVTAAPADRAYARILARHLELLLSLLEHHHEGEDRLLWPRLRSRAPEQYARAIDAAVARE